MKLLHPFLSGVIIVGYSAACFALGVGFARSSPDPRIIRCAITYHDARTPLDTLTAVRHGCPLPDLAPAK